MDLYLFEDHNGFISRRLYDKRDDFNFAIVNYPFLDSNIPEGPAYGFSSVVSKPSTRQGCTRRRKRVFLYPMELVPTPFGAPRLFKTKTICLTSLCFSTFFVLRWMSRPYDKDKALQVRSYIRNKHVIVYRQDANLMPEDLAPAKRIPDSSFVSHVTEPSSKQLINWNQYVSRFTIEERDTCTRDASGTRVVVVACSAMGHREQRLAIRQTWGSPGNLLKLGARLVFLLGKTSDENLQERVLKESAIFHDIIQADFLDTYENLTLKSISLVNWVRQYCMASTFVLKVDDDVFLNISRLNDSLVKLPPNSMTGFLLIDEPVERNNSKWGVPENEFSGEVYPPYFRGVGYVISTDMIPGLYNATLHTPFFRFEDVYVTGMCAAKLKPNYIDTSNFTGSISPTSPDGPSFVIRLNYDPRKLRKVWRAQKGAL